MSVNIKPVTILKRCKSECDVSQLQLYPKLRRDSSVSESSNEVFVINDSGTGSEDEGEREVLDVLERKMDRLSDLFLEQCDLLNEIKEDIFASRDAVEKSEQVQTKFVTELLKKVLDESVMKPEASADMFSGSARSLLDAIETRQAACLDRELRRALADCLQSQELKEQIVSATVASVRDMVRESLSHDVSRLYVPVLQRASRRLARMLTRALEDRFAELEAHSSQLSKSMCRLSRSLRRELQQHEACLRGDGNRFSYLRAIIEDTIEKEMKEWRNLAWQALEPEVPPDAGSLGKLQWAERGATPPPLEYPPSPPQPADPSSSVIDQLMMVAEINKQIEDGDVNGAFERALSAADLSLVMAACRACERRVVALGDLRQSTLLSLAQQLPTDMVHETQLKCKYLEEALINLQPGLPATRAHLPLVVGAVRSNLAAFLAKFPGHRASRRVALIAMAADHLLK